MGVMMLSKASFAFLALFMTKHRRVRAQHSRWALYDNIVGCALSAPDGSSPRGYSQILSGIDSESDMFFLNSSVASISVFCRLPFLS
jgi:hypothetical protein